MTTIIYILLIISLLVPAIEDMRQRSINWYWIPLVLISAFLLSYSINESLFAPLWNFLYNGFILLLMFFASKMYISIKNRAITRVIDNYLGLGDALMILAISVLFTPFYFIFFLSSVLFITLFAYALDYSFNNSRHRLIPLVSFLNISLMILLCFDYFLLDHVIFLHYQ